MTSRINHQHYALYFCIFLEYLVSMQLWIGWMKRSIYINLLLGLIMVMIIITQKIRLNLNLRNVTSAFVFVTAYFLYRGSLEVFEIVGFGISSFVIILLNDKDRINCWNCLFRWFAILMIPSIVVYALCQTVGLPSVGIIRFSKSTSISQDYLLRYNYIFYNTSITNGIGWFRFNGPFNEPGHVGMMTAFMLFADGYNFKKRSTWVILISLVLSMSLAGYVLCLFGYIFSAFEVKKNILKWGIPLIVFIGGTYLFGTYYNHGDNFINELVFSRLELDEDRGIVGNNRASAIYYVYFDSQLDDANLLLHGIGSESVKELHESGKSGTGFIAWMVEFGLIGLMQAFLFYIVYLLLSRNKKETALFFVFVVLAFLQRSYPYWFAWVICYAYGTTLRGIRSVKN